ncbi:hypothetical protein [Scytonema sp. NUACC26]|uniref:hypothetical protein n=1 Tax=Scytonema sp. NUACC26 TaxID=3140176 RepID=UPI0038B3E924
MVRLYARSLKGERAHGERPDKRGKNVTIVGAMRKPPLRERNPWDYWCDEF